ncbi:hypothetical protein HPB48_009886 [Haemaphysalis longicornis]|uniref:Uncharacterized protein n=1 Tax=Haemaphysalis longicornis TaxID=44386 RepID=A0A9J6GET8_HAELO|nr:hypothetical protein HPB48_009886 [Haemaphysalis longicornis]
MGVKTAVQLFSPPVTAALQYLKDQAGHTCDLEFANVGPTVESCRSLRKWFALMDVSNTVQYLHTNDPDSRHFTDPDDERLTWLETAFLNYISSLKAESLTEIYLIKETEHALVLTTTSNVLCIRFLLNDRAFKFVITRKFSSDPIESLLGFLRRSAGCNDALDMRSVVCGLEKMLKTGTVSSSMYSKVNASTTFFSATSITCNQVHIPSTGSGFFPEAAERGLLEHCTSPVQRLADPEVASVALMGGYLVRVVHEKWNCQTCFELVEKPKGDAPVDGLIKHQDRGGLKYPTSELVAVIMGIKKFVEAMLPHRRTITKPLDESVKRAVRVLMNIPVLVCEIQRGRAQGGFPGTFV